MVKHLKAGQTGVSAAISAKNMVKQIPPKFNTTRPLKVAMLVKRPAGKSAVSLKGPYA